MTLQKAILCSALAHLLLMVFLIKTELLLIKPSETIKPLFALLYSPEEVYRKEKRPLQAAPAEKPPRPGVKKIERPLKNTSAEVAPSKKTMETTSENTKKAFTRSSDSVPSSTNKPSSADKQDLPSTEPSLPKTTVKALPSGRELLDSEIISRIARSEARTKPDRTQEITFEVKELKFQTYMEKLKRRIESIWIYPPEAAKRGIFGDLYIRFTIKKDGSLGAIELLRTSGYRELDEAAIQALKDAQPYWPLPESWNTEAITIKGHFIYTLYGTYIR